MPNRRRDELMSGVSAHPSPAQPSDVTAAATPLVGLVIRPPPVFY